ncbi:MAG: metallophosphoesterase [Eubacteriales bacterium]|nr:metallophosphoesterase [Eubacteriales bacterium]
MRYLLISDTHGDQGSVERVLQICGRVEQVFHGGDVLGGRIGKGPDPFALYLAALPKFTAVRGNCDFPQDGREEGLDLSQELRLEAFDGRLILMHHGHRYNFKQLLEKAKSLGAEVVLSGHSHRKELFKTQGIIFVNPGSTARPRDGIASFALYQDGSFALVDLYTGQVLARKSFTDADDF